MGMQGHRSGSANARSRTDSSKKRHAQLAGALLMATMAGSAHAATVSYFLDQSNIAPLPDGNNYLQVTISDSTTVLGNIDFRVETLAPLNSIQTSGYGIDQFGFNTTNALSGGNFVLPTNWTYGGTGNMDGFGLFVVRVDTNGAANRASILDFSITGIAGDTVYDYVNPSAGNAGQGNELFAAHVAGFDAGGTTSGFFAGSTPVPVPAAIWLLGPGLLALVGVAGRRQRVI